MDESLVCAKFALPKKYGPRGGFTQEVETTIYNLDVIISVGYRVKSQRGVQFRQWANRVLKDYLIKGFSVNDKLRREQLSDLLQLVQIVGRTVQSKAIENTDETQAIFDVVLDYTYALVSCCSRWMLFKRKIFYYFHAEMYSSDSHGTTESDG